MIPFQQNEHGSNPLRFALKDQLEQFSENASRLGQGIRPYSFERKASGFLALSPERHETILKNLRICVEATEYALSQPGKSGGVFLWRALKSFGLQPPEDLFEKLEEDSCIEVYDQNGIWIYGNIQFYGITSYSLADLYEFPWHALWHRGELDQARISALGARLLSGQIKGSLLSPLPPHVVKEQSRIPGVEAELGMEMGLCPLLVAPLYERGTQEVAGFLHSFRNNWIRPTKIEADLPETNNTKVFKTPSLQNPAK